MKDKKLIYKKAWFWVAVIIIVFFIICVYIIIHDSNIPEQHESIKYCEVDSDCVKQSYKEPMCGVLSNCFNKNERPLSYIFSTRFFMKAACEPMIITCCGCDNGKCTAYYPDTDPNAEEKCSKET